MILLLSCAQPPEPAATASLLEPLPAPMLLRRISLDLRGVLPEVADLDAVEADPALLDSTIEAYLDDPRLEDRLVSIFAEQWHTRISEFEADHKDFHLDDSEEFPFVRSVGEEPLRLMARIAVTDRPWTEIVTADYTVADDLLASIWPLDYPAGATGWQEATYTDGRPPAGVLGTNGLWWRYVTSNSNMNRSRVAAISRLLLCEDYLERPVSFSQTGGLSDEDIDAAIQTEPGCIGCHSSIEPIAATLFGFFPAISYSAYELSTYHPERELLGELLLDTEAAWFGTPIEGLADLGYQITADSRFYRCAVERTVEGLWRRPVAVEDFAIIEELRDDFIRDGLLLRALIRRILDTDAYRVGAVSEAAGEELQQAALTRRLLTPHQLATLTEDLSGFVWTDAGHDLMDSDVYGFRVMAGGVDGELVTAPQTEPGLTWALVRKRLAEGAAGHAVIEVGEFGGVSVTGEATGDALAELWWRLHAQRPTDAEVAGLLALWDQAEALEDEAAAWQVVLSAMMRAPGAVVY